jgi:PAS domain S-box-containing protein
MNELHKELIFDGSDIVFRELVDQLPEPVFAVDSSGLVMFANRRAMDLTGYSLEDLAAGVSAYDVFFPESRDLVKTDINRMFRGEKSGAIEYRMRRKDGSEFWALVNSRPIFSDGKPVGFTGLLMDISDRKRTEEELDAKRAELEDLVHKSAETILRKKKELGDEVKKRLEAENQLARSENLYRTLVDSAKDVIWTADLDLKYTFLSQSVLNQLQYRVDEMVGASLLDTMTPESRKKFMEIFEQELLPQGLPPHGSAFIRTDEIVCFRKDGSRIWLELTLSFLRNRDGLAEGILGISRDISGRKTVEEALKKTQDELEQKVQDRTARLLSLNRDLKQEMSDRKLAEKALRNSELRFRTLFETAPDFIFIKDTELRYTHVNPSMFQKLRADESQVIGKTDEDIFGQAYSKQSKKLESRVLQGENIETEQNITIHDRKCVFNIIRSPMKDPSGKVTGVCGMARDLTDRKLVRREFVPKPDHYVSPAMQKALSDTLLVAHSESVVLFLGESGSGKDFLARYLHDNSNRSNGPFIMINCAALPETLVESELFGHESGSFTGCSGRKRGLVELAEGGTFLLNEVGDLPLQLQAKLLKFLDDKSFIRVGGQKEIHVNSRILAASNKDIEEEVKANKFRADLYYRLNVFTIQVPPLRSRLQDLNILARDILEFLSIKMGRSVIPSLDENAMAALASYAWPGNVRELRNVLERALIISERSHVIRVEHLVLPHKHGTLSEHLEGASQHSVSSLDLSLPDRMYQFKKTLIEDALARSGGRVNKTAALLGISRDSLTHHMKSLGIQR